MSLLQLTATNNLFIDMTSQQYPQIRTNKTRQRKLVISTEASHTSKNQFSPKRKNRSEIQTNPNESPMNHHIRRKSNLRGTLALRAVGVEKRSHLNNSFSSFVISICEINSDEVKRKA